MKTIVYILSLLILIAFIPHIPSSGNALNNPIHSKTQNYQLNLIYDDTIVNFSTYLHKGYQMVEPDSALALLKRDVYLKIIDTRIPDVFIKGHLANAINIDKNDVTLLEKLDRLNKSENYLLYSDADDENTGLIHMMRQHNFTGNIYYLKGGYKKWLERNLPTAM